MTNNKTRHYKIDIDNFVVLSDSIGLQNPWLVRDNEEEKIEKKIEKSFNKGCEVFLRHFGEFKSLEIKMTKEEEKDLKIMLENLVYVKKVLQDK